MAREWWRIEQVVDELGIKQSDVLDSVLQWHLRATVFFEQTFSRYSYLDRDTKQHAYLPYLSVAGYYFVGHDEIRRFLEIDDYTLKVESINLECVQITNSDHSDFSYIDHLENKLNESISYKVNQLRFPGEDVDAFITEHHTAEAPEAPIYQNPLAVSGKKGADERDKNLLPKTLKKYGEILLEIRKIHIEDQSLSNSDLCTLAKARLGLQPKGHDNRTIKKHIPLALSNEGEKIIKKCLK